MQRKFRKSQKVDLWLAANGKCQYCGVDLPSDWHADHIKPFSKGGETSVENGMALCPTCNLRKSNKVTNDIGVYLPDRLKLRRWQERFVSQYFKQTFSGESHSNFLLVATPGAGKTIAQMTIAYNLLKAGSIDWICVCVPTDHLRNQMALDAVRFGLDLYHGLGFASVNDGFHGEVLTYAQVAANPGVWKQRCATSKVFLSADEVHHLGDDLTWGDSYKSAFEGARFRLFTSGTPFRSDDKQIPWIQYESDDEGNLRSKSDFYYGYGDGLRDSVCRHVVFPSFDADCKWLYGDQMISANFSADLGERESKRLIQAAISEDSDWMENVFQDANLRLSRIRQQGHDNAGGLIVCMDKRQAESVSKLVQRMTGKLPTLVTSDIADSSKKIKDFAKEKGPSASEWIVAVKMVSEGVDIKRLRLAIYATNILTEMYFRQLVGRVIRVVGIEEETAYVYVYPHPTLISYIEHIKAERDHFIKSKPSEESENLEGSRDDQKCLETEEENDAPQLKIFAPLSGNSFESDHWFNQSRYSIVEVSAIRDMAVELGIPEAKMAEIVRRLGKKHQIMPAAEIDISIDKVSGYRSNPESTSMEILKGKGKRANGKAFNLARILNIDTKDVHSYWISFFNGKKHETYFKSNDHESMDKKIFWLSNCIVKGSLLNPREIDFGGMQDD